MFEIFQTQVGGWELLLKGSKVFFFKSSPTENKSIASIIPAIAIICLFIVAKMSGKKMTEGQITILNQILIISMDR